MSNTNVLDYESTVITLNITSAETRKSIILSILMNGKSYGWNELYKKLVEQISIKVAPRDYISYLEDLLRKNLIDKIDDGKRGKKIKLSISELGKEFYKNKIDFVDLPNYDKSRFLLISLMGMGITYDTKLLSSQEIKNIQYRNDYHSISIKDIQRKKLNYRYRLFGYIDLNKEFQTFDKIKENFEFLVKKGILKIETLNNDERYIFANKNFIDFLSKCHGLLFYLFSLLKFIFLFIRKPSKDESIMLNGLFGLEFYNQLVKTRYNVQNVVKNLDHNNTEYISTKGKVIEKEIGKRIRILNKHLETISNSFSGSDEEKFFAYMILRLVFPQFLRSNYIKSLKIDPKEDYRWLSSELPYIIG